MVDQSNNNKTELSEIEEQEKYLLYSRTAIINVLSELSKRPDIITAYFNGGREYLLTAVLTVLPERDLVVLDYGTDEKRNLRMLAADRIVCVTKHDNISIKFSCEELQRAKFQERQAFAARLPETLFRLQRREFFRVSTPVFNPLKCLIPDEEHAAMEWNIVDISVGGVGLADPSCRFVPELGTLLRDCQIDLGEFGILICDMVVRNSFLQSQNDGSKLRRLGCAFVNLPLDKNATLQRYIHRIQIEQKAIKRE